MAGSAYSILVDVELNPKNLQSQLNKLGSKLKLDMNTGGLTNATKSINSLSDSMKNAGLTYQEANMIFDRSVQAISAMVEEVFVMDKAITEFRKVSDLDSSSLDAYIAKMTELGDTVGRTGQLNYFWAGMLRW